LDHSIVGLYYSIVGPYRIFVFSENYFKYEFNISVFEIDRK